MARIRIRRGRERLGAIGKTVHFTVHYRGGNLKSAESTAIAILDGDKVTLLYEGAIVDEYHELTLPVNVTLTVRRSANGKEPVIIATKITEESDGKMVAVKRLKRASRGLRSNRIQSREELQQGIADALERARARTSR